jgi:hypothetical protein
MAQIPIIGTNGPSLAGKKMPVYRQLRGSLGQILAHSPPAFLSLCSNSSQSRSWISLSSMESSLRKCRSPNE